MDRSLWCRGKKKWIGEWCLTKLLAKEDSEKNEKQKKIIDEANSGVESQNKHVENVAENLSEFYTEIINLEILRIQCRKHTIGCFF